IYGTFIFGYDTDTDDTFASAMRFAREQGLFIAAFNHITPFPGTPLYARMQQEGRLLYEAWWLDDRYRYNMIPFQPRHMSAGEVADRWVHARQQSYHWRSVAERAAQWVNRQRLFMLLNFVVINAMHQFDVRGRNGLPLGDEAWQGPLLKAS